MERGKGDIPEGAIIIDLDGDTPIQILDWPFENDGSNTLVKPEPKDAPFCTANLDGAPETSKPTSKAPGSEATPEATKSLGEDKYKLQVPESKTIETQDDMAVPDTTERSTQDAEATRALESSSIQEPSKDTRDNEGRSPKNPLKKHQAYVEDDTSLAKTHEGATPEEGEEIHIEYDAPVTATPQPASTQDTSAKTSVRNDPPVMDTQDENLAMPKALGKEFFLRKKAEKKTGRNTVRENERQLGRDLNARELAREIEAKRKANAREVPASSEFKQDVYNSDQSPAATTSHSNNEPLRSGSSEKLSCDPGDDESEEINQARKEYREFKRRGEPSILEEIKYIKAKEKEAQRINQRKEELRADKEDEERGFADADNDGLFLSDDDDDVSFVKPQSRQKGDKPLKAAPLPKIPQRDIDASRDSGRPKPKKSRKKKSAEGAKGAGETARAKDKKGLEQARPEKRKRKPAKGQDSEKPKKKRKRSGKRCAEVEGAFESFSDLANSGDFRPAPSGGETGEYTQPSFTSKHKKQALLELLASIPTEDQRISQMDRKALDRANKQFSHPRRVVPAPDTNGWRVKGMSFDLKNFQLIGVGRMREFEKRAKNTRGGIIADKMGLGKTVQMLANLVDGMPSITDPAQATLIVVPRSLRSQWMKETDNHLEDGVLSRVMIYDSNSKDFHRDPIRQLQQSHIVITTYDELRQSWPKNKPPEELSDEEAQEWWKDQYANKRGALHRVKWHRVVLDECQAVKNPESQTTLAAHGLIAKFRWLMSGTILLNNISEMFSYCRFLQAPHTGTFECFRHNYLKDDNGKDRLHEYVKTIMIRRTLDDEFLNAPIIILPATQQHTKRLDFHTLEAKIYTVVRSRCTETIQHLVKSGKTKGGKAAGAILWAAWVRMIALRQHTGHFLACIRTLSMYLTRADMHQLWSILEEDQSIESKETTEKLRKIFTKLEEDIKKNMNLEWSSFVVRGDDNQNAPRIQRQLGHNTSPTDATRLCASRFCVKCGEPPENPYITECKHILCSECLDMLQFDAPNTAQCRAICPVNGCRRELKVSLLEGARSIESDDLSNPANALQAPKNERFELTASDTDLIYLSAKMCEIKTIMAGWIQEKPDVKIIVFTQFLRVGDIVGTICKAEGWGHCTYNGQMEMKMREKMLTHFQDKPEKRVLVASLKAGGVGLNLTHATRAILVDLYWNSGIEQQAFSRIYRIGQDHRTEFYRLAIRDTVDERLISLQERKKRDIAHVLDGRDRGNGKDSLSLDDLAELFKPAEVDEDGQMKGFVYTSEVLREVGVESD